MSSDVGHGPTTDQPTHVNRRDPSYVGISCTNYGYTDYSRQSRNFSPVSRVPLDPPADGVPFATALTNRAFHRVDAICSPTNEHRIERALEAAARQQQNGGSANGRKERSSIIAQRIQSLYGEKTREEFKKRSKSAGPQQRNPYEQNFKEGLLELADKFDLEREELKPSNFPDTVKDKTAFVEKLLKKDKREGVKPLEQLKKPPKFDIPSRKKSDEYYKQQREIEKQKALQFSQRLKEAEEKRKAQEKIEVDQRKQAEEQARKEDEASRVETIPQYSTVECEQPQVVEQVIVNTSFGSSESFAESEQSQKKFDPSQKKLEATQQKVELAHQKTESIHQKLASTQQKAKVETCDQKVESAHQKIESTQQKVETAQQRIETNDQKTELVQRESELIEENVQSFQQKVESSQHKVETSQQKGADEVDSAEQGSNKTEVTQFIRSDSSQSESHSQTTTETSFHSPSRSSVVEQVLVQESADESSVSEQSELEKGSKEQKLDTKETFSEEEMAGNEFIVLLDDAESRIKKRVTITEEYLKETHSEDIHGRLRAAIGKGNLLIAQKCSQFRGLCEKNLQEPKEGEFPTTRGDLEGFWDMISLQIDQILEGFDDIEALRANNWKDPEPAKSPARSSSASPAKKKLPNPLKPRNASSDKQREEARKRVQEAKQRAAKQRAESGDSDLIL